MSKRTYSSMTEEERKQFAHALAEEAAAKPKNIQAYKRISIRLGDLYEPVQKRLRRRKLTISAYVQRLIAADLQLNIEVKRGRPKGK